MHVVEIGVKPHRLSGRGSGGRLYARTHLFSVHREEDHRLHAHRLDHIHGHAELATRVAFFSTRLRKVLRPQAEDHIPAAEWSITSGMSSPDAESQIPGKPPPKPPP